MNHLDFSPKSLCPIKLVPPPTLYSLPGHLSTYLNPHSIKSCFLRLTQSYLPLNLLCLLVPHPQGAFCHPTIVLVSVTTYWPLTASLLHSAASHAKTGPSRAEHSAESIMVEAPRLRKPVKDRGGRHIQWLRNLWTEANSWRTMQNQIRWEPRHSAVEERCGHTADSEISTCVGLRAGS